MAAARPLRSRLPRPPAPRWAQRHDWLPTARRLMAPAIASFTVAGALGAMYLFGPLPGLAVALLGVAAVGLLNSATAAVLAVVAVAVVVESKEGSAGALPALFTPEFGPLAPFDLLIVLAVAAVAIHLLRPGVLPRAPEPFVGPLATYLFALLAGSLTGWFAGADDTSIMRVWETALPLLLLPVLVVNVVRTRYDLRRALGAGALLAVAKALVGVAFVLLGANVALGGENISYYEPAANFLGLVTLLAGLAVVLGRVRLPTWLLVALPLLVASLLLSYRRSFWVAAVVGLVLVVVVASGRVGRRLLVPAAVLVMAAGWLSLSSGVIGQVSGPVVERAESLDPDRIRTNEQDRFRLAERRNVLADLRAHPITGLGLGVDWTGRYPLPFEYEGGRNYTHMAVLWHWSKLGLVGLVAYLWLMGAAVAAGWRVWRAERADRWVQGFGLAAAAGVVGLAVAELSAAFTGPDHRLTVVFGALLGLLAAAHRQVATAGAPDTLGTK